MGNSLGLIETIGLTGAVAAADQMLKSANVSLVGEYIYSGSGLITVMVQGEIGAVQAAVEAGEQAAGKLTTIKSVHVIPRPHADTERVFLANKVKEV